MDVFFILIVIMVILFVCGVYVMFEWSLIWVLIGFLLFGNVMNLLFLIVMGVLGNVLFFGMEGEMSDLFL